MIVGDKEKREVSELNNLLYTRAREILEQADKRGWHIGWIGLGDFIDWLESNYDICEKEDEQARG